MKESLDYYNDKNKILCEFMGNDVQNDTVIVSSGQRLDISEFKYQSDWNELMSVIQKIKKVIPHKSSADYSVDEIRVNCVIKLPISENIEIVWQFAVNFAEFYLAHTELY
jgi:hypothetical protein